MATPAQIEASARAKYNAVGDTFLNSEEFYDLIYEAETILAEEAFVIEKTYSSVSVASQREYAWPTLAISIKRIEYDGTKLTYSTFREDDNVTTSRTDTTTIGRPTIYQLWERNFYLRAIPDTDDLVIKVFSYDMPNLQSSPTANLDTPEHYKKDIINYVVANMAMKDGNVNVAQQYFLRWELGVKRAKKWQIKRRSVDGPRMVKNVDVMPQSYLSGLI